MIKIEHTELYGWEAAIRGMYDGKGVRFVYPNSYEANISSHGKSLYCGTYNTEQQAREAVATAKIKLFKENIIANGENPLDIVESVEKGYFASPKGNIYNRHGELMVGAVDRSGYRHTIMNGKNKNIHRVIAETFIENPENLPCVNHKDGNKLNNSVENLEWCTHSKNTKHAYENGLERKRCGEEHHAHKLTEKDVRYIKSHYIKRDKDFGAVPLSKKFNVDRTTIHDIVNKKTWKEVAI